MNKNSVIFFTDNRNSYSQLVSLIETICDVSFCSFSSGEWNDVDFYSKSNIAFIIDDIPENGDFVWILSKLSEANVFSEVPVIFTTYSALYSFERMGFLACACDVLPEPFDYEVARRRIENLIEIHQLKQQILNLTQIHTKRILNQANKLKEQNTKIQSMNFDLVELLVAAIESRDLESGQHIKRIRYLAKALTDVVIEQCPEYNITKEQADYIFFGSSVHDIGKIAIPDAIMLKPGRLTREEYEIMKTHTTRGAKLLNMLDEIGDSEYFQYCKDICLYHHERWDGKGYPKGLKGDATPISAQIVAVADCYDALTSDRPYKSALSHAEASELILNGACGLFSPQLMNCFRKALSEFARIENDFKKSSSGDDKYDYTIIDPHEPPHEECEPEEETSKYDSALTQSDNTILSAYDLVFVADIQDGFFEVTRGSWTRYFSYVPKNYEECISQCLKRCYPSDCARFTNSASMESLLKLAKQGKTKSRVEFRALYNDEEIYVIGFLTFDVNEEAKISKVYGAFNVYNDEELYSEVKQSFTITDGLTGLMLEGQLGHHVDDFIKQNPQSKNLIIYIDIDDMGMINNLFGYEYGNLLIKEIAAKLRELSDGNKVIAKSVSDKFVLFVKDIKRQSEVILFIEKLHNTLRKSYRTTSDTGELTVTMGISRYPNDGNKFKQLLNAADYASKAAKINGKSAYAFYNNGMKNVAALSFDSSMKSNSILANVDYEPRFAPVVTKASKELVCYDYIPFSVFDESLPVTAELFYNINKDLPSKKNLSLLSIKTLMYMLVGAKNNGMKVPPISAYTLFSPDDIPGVVQELRGFVEDNDCSEIDLCIMLPQDFLEGIDQRKLKTFAQFIKSIGFSLGLYLIGDRYIHNDCYIDDVFERYVLTTEYIERSIINDASIVYSAETINKLRDFVPDVTVPTAISDADAKKLINAGATDFSESLDAVIGIDALIKDYADRGNKVKIPTVSEVCAISDLSRNELFYDITRSDCVILSYDINSDKAGITENAEKFFGFDICSHLNNNKRLKLSHFIHPDDIEQMFAAVSKAKISLQAVNIVVRVIADDKNERYQKCAFSIMCVVDSLGVPLRLHCFITHVAD